MKADVIIIGAGIIGCSIAYHLAKGGLQDVIVIDKGGVASGVTGICPGGVRQQWGTRINCDMAKASVGFFKNINEMLEPEYEIKFREVGYLYTFHSEEALKKYEVQRNLQINCGIPTQMLTAKEARGIIPGLNTESVFGASFCPTDGFVDDAYHVTNSFAHAAKRQGVRFINDQVTSIDYQGDRITGVQTQKRGRIVCDQLVNAAGLGAKEIASLVGVELPIVEETRRILYTNRLEERVLEPLLVSFERGFAAKQLTDGTICLSYLGSDQHYPYDTYSYLLRAAEVGIELFPKLANLEFRSHVDGRYDATPDHQAILGDVDGLLGYFQAVGMSGHGFMMAPAIGKGMAELILGHESTIDISPLHFRRFEKNELIIEPSVV
ncbi:NAD(P)/FAD-dependent oxidoreductase [Pseudalkalibacillus berkeleyi]|uniref:FAD-binding oxidoreductase n=1 Tax=Pseudalkalibacillus berkeleyi TaxID=1069813 RepID=A0ABS9H0A6_9BACL|nr:FAD-binding oxidoreductase [Pseudalkalibacillus berkeleyi]MCF6138417.1 FAD-binding oxidoreductase [Pseudalkalibacillus berkeleyi]